jgi:thiosulfate/3-mercaptopyruvate sulfurtransferase
VESNPPATFDGAPNRDMLVLLDDVSAQPLLVDARDDARFRGDTAGPDARAGHIPGAKQRHFSANWDAQQALLPPAELRAQFEALFGDVDSADVTFYCGSGVSACVNILAQVHAGLRPGKLYVGSWSEWSRTDRPAEREA